MTGIFRWGKLSGKNRGGAEGQGRKCEKSEGLTAVKVEDVGVKNRGILQSRCAKTYIVDGALIEVKSNPHPNRKNLQEEGIVKKVDFCDMKGKPTPYSKTPPKEGVLKKTDLCEKGFDAAHDKNRTKFNQNNTRVGVLRNFEPSEKGVDTECMEKSADGAIMLKGIQGVKQGMPETRCRENTKKGAWDTESMEDAKMDSDCKEDAMRCMHDNKDVKQGSLDMEQGISNRTHMLCVRHDIDPVEKEKKGHSCNEDGDVKCTDSTNSVTSGKPGDADYMNVVVHNKAGDGQSITSTQSNASIGSDSKSTKVMQWQVCRTDVEEKNDDVYEKPMCADSELMSVPHDFVCGISKKVMEDPVVIASGQTFERACIQAWLDEGNTCCPVTHEPLAHLQLIPNLSLKALISSWYSQMQGSVLKILEETDLYSCSSSSSSSSLPKLLLDAERLLSFSSSSAGSMLSYATPEHLRAAGIYNFPSSTSSNSPSSSWDQERDVFAGHEDTLQSAKSRQGEEIAAMSKISHQGNAYSKFSDSMGSSAKSCAYIVSRINSLVSDLHSEHVDIQRSAAAELRLLAKEDNGNRLMIASAGALRPLVALTRSRDVSIQLEATTALLNLSLNPSLKDSIVKEGAIDALVSVLRDAVIPAAKENAAVMLACLATSEENKSKIGWASAVEPLVNLLERGSPRGRKDAATALYRLSSNDENKKRVVRAGATRLLVGFMSREEDKDGMVDKAIVILGNLVSIEEGRVAFVEEGGVLSLLQVFLIGSKLSKGLAVSILFQICTHSSRHRSLVLQMDILPTLMELSKTGNARLKTQIAEVIEVLLVDA